MSYPAKLPMQVRSAVLEFKRRTRAAEDGADPPDAGDEVYDVVISSETPCERWFGLETLSHQRSAIDMSFARNGLPLLLEHGKSLAQGYAKVDPALQVGIVENVALGDDAKLRGEARFSRSALAQQIRQDVEDGIRPWLSVGYIPIKAKQTKVAQKENEKHEYLVTRWQPVEVSIVSLPADPNAGVGRSAGGEEFPVEVETTAPNSEVTVMSKPTGAEPTTQAAASPPAPAATVETRTNGAGGDAVPTLADRNAEIAQIIDVCEANGLEKRAREWIQAGLSYDKVCRSILDLRKSEPKPQPAAEMLREMKAKDRAKYSYGRVVRHLAGIEKHLDGVEAEVHEEILKDRVEGVQVRGGVFVPLSLEPDTPRSERTMASNLANKGADLVFDRPGELIEILRATSVLSRMGARIMSGLSGPITFPKQTGDAVVSWVGENPAADVSATDLDIDSVIMQPKTLIGASQFSRQLLMQTAGVVDALVRESLGVGSGLALDRGGLHGTGAAAQPTGVYAAPDVQSVAMGSVTPTWTKITDMIGQVGDKNALLGSLGFITTALLGARLLATLQASAAGSQFIWTGPLEDGRIGGYRAIASTQASKTLGAGSDEHAFVFGNWNDCVVGLWGATELILDEVTGKKKGLIEIASFQMGDVIFRHGESFSKGTAAKPA
jgi:HK97 family phage major capsid protein